MQRKALPRYDDCNNPAGGCPRFNPDGRERQELHVENKDLVRAITRSLLPMPVDMDCVFSRVQGRIADAGAYEPGNCIVLSRDLRDWQAEHPFSDSRPVPDEEAVTASENFVTRVFEGPYREAGKCCEEMAALARARGGASDKVCFFYSTCPSARKRTAITTLPAWPESEASR